LSLRLHRRGRAEGRAGRGPRLPLRPGLRLRHRSLRLRVGGPRLRLRRVGLLSVPSLREQGRARGRREMSRRRRR